MAEEFNMYTAKVEDLGNNIADLSAKYLAKIEEVTSIVNNLSSVWGGPTYDTFLASYNEKLSNLHDLNDLLNKMSENVGGIASAGEDMINKINNAM